MPRSGDDGAFPIWIWDGETIGRDDGAFPMGIGEFVPVPPGAAVWIVEVLLDGTVIWNSISSSGQQNMTVDVSQYIGKKTLKFRLRRTG